LHMFNHIVDYDLKSTNIIVRRIFSIHKNAFYSNFKSKN